MTPPRPRYTPSPQRQELRKRMLTLLVSVVVVHAAVIGIYYALRVQDRPMKTQQMFIGVWIVLMMAVVVPQMKGIRQMRRKRG